MLKSLCFVGNLEEAKIFKMENNITGHQYTGVIKSSSCLDLHPGSAAYEVCKLRQVSSHLPFICKMEII